MIPKVETWDICYISSENKIAYLRAGKCLNGPSVNIVYSQVEFSHEEEDAKEGAKEEDSFHKIWR